MEYAFDKISMGPELLSMEQTKDGMHKTAIHEGGHCLCAYLLNKAGQYDSKGGFQFHRNSFFFSLNARF